MLSFATAFATAAVTPLTASNYSVVESDASALWLLKFYAPWCGHCKRLAPILDEVSEEVSGVHFGKIDCTVEKQLCEKHSVKGYPKVLVMQDGKTWEHRGQRSKDGILALLRRMQRPSVAAVATQGELEAASAAPVLFLLARAVGSATAHASFEAVARTRQHADTFAATDADKVLQHLGLSETPRPFIARLEPGEQADILHADTLGAMDEAALETWVGENRLPVFSMLDRDNFWDLSQNPDRPLAALLVDPCGGSECDTPLRADAAAQGAGAELRRLSRDAQLRHQFYFGLLDGRKWKEFAVEHYVELQDMPRLLVLKSGATRSFFVNEGGAEPAEFLRRVSAGEARAEYEGWWGKPERWWRTVLLWLPALAPLQVLPRYSFVAPLLILATILLARLLFWAPGDHHEKDE